MWTEGAVPRLCTIFWSYCKLNCHKWFWMVLTEFISCISDLPSCFFSLQYPSLVLILISFSGHSTQLTRICCLCHAATAALDNKAFPTVPLKCGITYHFRSDSPLHSISIGTTWKLTTLPITDLRTTASSASDSTLHSTNCYEWKRLLPCETLTSVSTGGISTELQDGAVD